MRPGERAGVRSGGRSREAGGTSEAEALTQHKPWVRGAESRMPSWGDDAAGHGTSPSGGRGTRAGPAQLSVAGTCLSCRDSSGAGGRDPRAGRGGGGLPGFLGPGSSELSRLAFSRVPAFPSCSGGCPIAWTEPPFLFECSPEHTPRGVFSKH